MAEESPQRVGARGGKAEPVSAAELCRALGTIILW